MLCRSLAVIATSLALASCATPSLSLTRPSESTASEFAPEAARSVPSAEVAAPPAEAAAPSAEREVAAAPPQEVPEQVTDDGLQSRLAARARAFLGRRGPFRAGGERFNGDCSGFVEAVYAAEGLALRELVKQEAPTERSAVKAVWIAAQRHGRAFGADETPVPGDLVFWHDTYHRNHNRKAENRFTHIGIVERVEDGTVHFLHRGRRGVVRGVMTLGRSHEASAPDGHPLNSHLRARSHPVKQGGLAGELFAGYARLDAASLVRQGRVAARSRGAAECASPTPNPSRGAQRGSDFLACTGLPCAIRALAS
jgi:hypothetical protein